MMAGIEGIKRLFDSSFFPALGGNSGNVQSGMRYYRWSMKMGAANRLDPSVEHQLVFWEAHFADIKYGGSGGDNLWFSVNGQNGNTFARYWC